MSKSSTKSSSTNTSTNNSTTTPTVAPWLSNSYEGLNSLIGKYASSDPTSFVTQLNDVQKMGISGAQNLGGWQKYLSQGADLASSAGSQTSTPITAANILSMDRAAYTNPYTQDVVDTTLDDFDVDAGRTRAAQEAQAAKARAFGGSRYAVREAQTEGELSRARATTAAGLRDQAFNTASGLMQADAQRAREASQFNASLSQADLQRQLQAAQLMGSFGSASGENARADVNSQLTAGQQQYAVDNANTNALPTWLQNLSSLYGSIPIGSFTSLNQTGNQTGSTTGKTSTTSMGMSFNPPKGFSIGG